LKGKMKIYLDTAATTPVDERVLEAMLPYFSDQFGNASSIHQFGQIARAAIDKARETIGGFLGCKSSEIIFTSGGSESDNLALKGVVESNKWKASGKPHVVTSAFEHHAVLDVVKELEADGKIEATYVRPNREGLVEVADVEAAIKPSTVLVSIMYVNNEIGTVQPIREIGKMIERVNRDHDNRIYFHTDAVQAAEYFNMDVNWLHVDLLTMTAHKIYGPKGIGLLYVRSGTPLKHQIVGGGQEYKKRAGTENVAGIVGFAKAVELINLKESAKISKLRDRLIDGLLNNIPDSFLNGSRKHRSPANANISFMNAEGESILLNLDMEGVAASTGSACTSGSLEPSHVLISMGLKPEECHGSVRFTLGRSTTQAEIDKVLAVMPKIIKKLRAMSPIK